MARSDEFLNALLAGAEDPASSLRHVERLVGRTAIAEPWPEWADAKIIQGYRNRGVSLPWSHQKLAAESLRAGHTTALATSTGSGKSLGFWLPILTAVREGREQQRLHPGRITQATRPSALYLSPTKALASDQHASLTALLRAADVADVITDVCDGDTPREAREWIRAHADVVLTNPDFLHHALLPQHDRWARFLRDLRFIVVDEGHSYRGVFGAHLALIVRRLQRLAAHHRHPGDPAPVFVLASATTADPALSAARLAGLEPGDVEVVDQDGSPAGARTFVLWQPPEIRLDGDGVLLGGVEDATGARRAMSSTPVTGDRHDEQPEASGFASTVPGFSVDVDLAEEPSTVTESHARRSAVLESAQILATLVVHGARALAFTRSRRGAETLAAATQAALRQLGSPLSDRIAAYRGGYLPEERRALERAITDGSILALATTNALELGIDISGLDAVVICGWPGTRASIWQQAGRAGRAGAPGLVVFVAREDPLDTFLVNRPESLFSEAIEATTFDPANRYVLAPHLCAAASELPLRPGETALFGPTSGPLLDELVAAGLLRRRAAGWYWTRPESATSLADLRGTGSGTVSIIEHGTGRVIGTLDSEGADSALHTGAVYVHQGHTFQVADYRPADHVAVVVSSAVDYRTWARSAADLHISHVREERTWQHGAVEWGFGDVEVTSRVTEYQRRRGRDGIILGTYPLELPERSLSTTAVWWTVSTAVLDQAGLEAADLPGALHAAEHAAIGVLPLLATCDRSDLGGLSTVLHPDTEQATIFVHDGIPGGAGFAERAFHLAAPWLAATADVIRSCSCAMGCPACIQSPKCGNGNHPLNKVGALRLLDVILSYQPSVQPETSPQ